MRVDEYKPGDLVRNHNEAYQLRQITEPMCMDTKVMVDTVPEEITPSGGNVFTDLGLKVCGNCDYHSQEGDDGMGACDGQRTSVKYTCDCWAPRRDND